MATAPITILKLMGDHAGLEFLTPTSPCIAIEIADQDRFHVSPGTKKRPPPKAKKGRDG